MGKNSWCNSRKEPHSLFWCCLPGTNLGINELILNKFLDSTFQKPLTYSALWLNLYRDLEPNSQHAEPLVNFRALPVEALMKMQLLWDCLLLVVWRFLWLSHTVKISVSMLKGLEQSTWFHHPQKLQLGTVN